MFRRIAGILMLCALSACGGYASNSEAFRRSMRDSSPERALAQVNDALGVDRAEQLPSEPGPDTPLLLLERATILQAMGRHKLSARDYQAADKVLDVLDLTNDTAGNISKYIFSDDATVYKTPPHEKLLLNTLNMLNYLAMGNTSGAKVEARRLVVNQKYLDGEGEGARSMLAFSSFLAGFSFEVAGEAQAAMRHYGDAKAAGGLPGLAEAVRELNAYSGATDERVKDYYGTSKVDPRETGHLLVVVQTGMAPFKQDHRVPVAQALLIMNRGHRRHRLSARDRARAQRIAAKGLVTWVNYPSLKRLRNPHTLRQVNVDGQMIPAQLALNVEDKVIDEFDRIQPSLVAAALTRMLARAAAGALTEGAAKSKSKGGSALALLAGLAVQGTMVALDTPDTRTWVTLPGRIYTARTRLPPGEHTIAIRVGSFQREAVATVKAGGYTVLNFSAMR